MKMSHTLRLRPLPVLYNGRENEIRGLGRLGTIRCVGEVKRLLVRGFLGELSREWEQSGKAALNSDESSAVMDTLAQ